MFREITSGILRSRDQRLMVKGESMDSITLYTIYTLSMVKVIITKANSVIVSYVTSESSQLLASDSVPIN